MRWTAALLLYRLLLPLLFVAAFPAWLLKMLRRDGMGTALLERAGIYEHSAEFEPCGAIHIHSVSVGETLLALKLVREWRKRAPQQEFVIATGTATGHHVATAATLDGVRVTYAPLDFRWMVRRYLARFEPSSIVLIEGEVWPHLMLACKSRGIPVTLVNARVSPSSARRYRRFAPWIRPLFSRLRAVAIQERADSALWRDLGVPAECIQHTGSLKFDPGSGKPPRRREEFQRLLDRHPDRGPVILASSTHPGEHAWVARTARQACPGALIAIAPRHVERRAEVQQELLQAGLGSILRSQLDGHAIPQAGEVLVIDTTGELKDWAAHADVAIIGKSLLATGGQNPCEAIQAGRPVICGPHMENFEPLASQLREAGGILPAASPEQLASSLRQALDPRQAALATRNASQVLQIHAGATGRIIDLIEGR